MGCCPPVRKTHRVKSYSVFTGYFYFINFIIGTGFLSLPYVFYHAGILASVFTLMFISTITYSTAMWIVESMARAQAIERAEQSTSKSLNEVHIASKPDFELTLARKFELTEMCQVFYNRYVKWVFILVMSVYQIQGAWASAAVAGSAWATNIPFNTSTLQQCTEDDFNNVFIPLTVECANTYRLCVFIFGVIVVILSLIDLTEQFIIQVTMGVMRFVTMACMMIFCVVRVIESHGQPPIFSTNISSLMNVSVPDNSSHSSHSSHLSIGEAFLHFDFKVWLTGIPIFVFSQLTHQGIVTMTGPMRQKKYLKLFFVFLVSSTFCIYTVMAISVAIYFQGYVSNTASLNWVPWIQMDGYIALKVLSYYIILFPSLDVMTAYPLGNTAVANNVYTMITGKDSNDDKRRYAKLALLGLKFVCSIIPLALAFAVSNLLDVVQYAGLLGFTVALLFPAMVQFASQYHCMKIFENTPNGINSGDEVTPLLGHRWLGGLTSASLWKRWWLTWKNPAYWTPHSTIISHPISVAIICVICLLLFGLSVGSFFVPGQ